MGGFNLTKFLFDLRDLFGIERIIKTTICQKTYDQKPNPKPAEALFL